MATVGLKVTSPNCYVTAINANQVIYVTACFERGIYGLVINGECVGQYVSLEHDQYYITPSFTVVQTIKDFV